MSVWEELIEHFFECYFSEIIWKSPQTPPETDFSDKPITHYGQAIRKGYPKIVQRHFEEKYLLNASQFGFGARHSTALQCMRLTDHVILNFNNNMSTAAVFLDIEKAFHTTWHPGLLYKLSKLEFSARIIKLISSFPSKRKFSLGWRRDVYAKRNTSRGATRFRHVPNSL
jgi:hypothetical protein